MTYNEAFTFGNTDWDVSVYRVHPPSKGRKILVACGPGNNGFTSLPDVVIEDTDLIQVAMDLWRLAICFTTAINRLSTFLRKQAMSYTSV